MSIEEESRAAGEGSDMTDIEALVVGVGGAVAGEALGTRYLEMPASTALEVRFCANFFWL